MPEWISFFATVCAAALSAFAAVWVANRQSGSTEKTALWDRYDDVLQQMRDGLEKDLRRERELNKDLRAEINSLRKINETESISRMEAESQLDAMRARYDDLARQLSEMKGKKAAK